MRKNRKSKRSQAPRTTGTRPQGMYAEQRMQSPPARQGGGQNQRRAGGHPPGRPPAGHTVRDAEMRARFAQLRKRRQRKKRIRMLLLLLLIAAAGVVLSLTVFFKVETIQVKGTERYSAEWLIERSGIAKGQDNLFLVSADGVEKNILRDAPYISAVVVSRKLPGTIILQIKETSTAFYIEADKQFILLDSAGKVLEIAGEAPDAATRIQGVTVTQQEPGKTVGFKDETALNDLIAISDALKESSFSNITAIDLSQAINYTITYDGRIDLIIGQLSDLSYKLELAKETILDLDEKNPEVKGEINLKQAAALKAAYFKQWD